MRIRPALLAASAGVMGILAALPLSAHHSFSAEFDGSKRIELKGVVTKLEWANPHTFFYIDVKDGKGGVVNWACETNGPNGLIRAGWKRNSLKVGDMVTVDGYRAKDGSNMMDARLVTLPDGRKVFAGNSDDGGPGK
ncbi:MAG TPA: DUF6152 family protein [Bryobacteraceae bacterium]|nr:DUF6152 family protein [Bryobacteraceae bacterium]